MSSRASPGRDVVVRHCTVEVVRHGGWSWGPNPDLITRRVLDALPELLARELDGLPDGDEDMEITEPVVLDVRFRLPELLPGHPGRISTRFGAGPGLADVAVQVPAHTPETPSLTPARRDTVPVPGAGPPADPVPPPAPPGAPVAAFITELAARQELAALLELLLEPTRDALVAGLAQAVGSADPDAVLPALLPALARLAELATLLDLLPTATLVAWRDLWVRYAAAAVTGAAMGGGMQADNSAAITAALDRVLARRPAEEPAGHFAMPDARSAPRSDRPGAPASASPVGGDRSAASSTAPGTPFVPPAPTAPAVAIFAANRARGPVEVESVLPFLITRPLARLGVLDALLPALAATGTRDGEHLTAQAQLVAAALGYTVLRPLQRGWLRDPADRAATAAFAGIEEVPDEALVELVRTTAAAAPVLDAVIALALCRGHSPARPLLLAEVAAPAGGGLLLADPEGLFPIAWTDDAELVLRHWTACGRPIVLLGARTGPDAVLGPVAGEQLRRLAGAGIRFATDLPPTRGERWRRVPGRRGWISPGGGPPPDVAASLARMPGELARLDELVRALAVERRAVPQGPITGLARTVALAAALGLGTISWLLWKDHEPADPLLALQRFADLSGVVQYGRDEVAVRVPLGRRHADLLRNGLLADVRDVPWLHGRTLTITGG